MITIIFVVYLILILVEVGVNHRIIEYRKQRPIYKRRSFIRITVGLVFAFTAYWLIPYYNWLGLLIAMPFTFWFVFDYGLNLSRSKSLMYLNPNGSWLDRMQTSTMGIGPWFFFKLMFMLIGTWLYFKGIDITWIIPH